MSVFEQGHELDSRFVLQRLLGTGGVGEVWLADDLELNKAIALKVLRPEFAADDVWSGLLRAEYQRLKQLQHPGIVRAFDFFESGPREYLTMEYLAGDSLKTVRGQPWRQVVASVLPVTDALEYAHRADIIHRDLKSSNIIVANGRPVLADFGTAASLSGGAELDNYIKAGGSLPAMSPQQLAGAPPAVSDDVYGFGALLYELVSGAPLFHPDVTEAKVLSSQPARLDTLAIAETPPPELVGLVATMLQKNPLQRPQSIATVRSALESLMTDASINSSADAAAATVIRPRRRPRTATVNEPIADATRTAAEKKDSTRWVYVAVGVLLAVLIAVVLWLPDVVATRRAAEESMAPVVVQEPTDEPADEAPVASLEARESAEDLLGELLPAIDTLTQQGVDLWGGNDWIALRNLAASADEAYKRRKYQAATDGYREALTLAEALNKRVEIVLADALREGTDALAAADGPKASARFELALAVDQNNAEARKGLQRAANLDQVLEQMNAAALAENDEDWNAAASAYRAALAIDPEWQPATAGLRRVSGAASNDRYSKQMGQGYEALSAKRYIEALGFFNAALKERPGDVEAQRALDTVNAEQLLARIRAAAAKAKIAEATERWSDAVARYEEILQLDSAVISAQEGRERAAARAELDGQLRYELTRAETFNDPRAWERANGVLNAAKDIAKPGPVLKEQMATLDAILMSATIPVPVTFRSDGKTDVVVYKVGRIGSFETKVLELRPGRYTAVGNREGYRDVRANFLVTAGESMPPVVLECKEPI